MFITHGRFLKLKIKFVSLKILLETWILNYSIFPYISLQHEINQSNTNIFFQFFIICKCSYLLGKDSAVLSVFLLFVSNSVFLFLFCLLSKASIYSGSFIYVCRRDGFIICSMDCMRNWRQHARPDFEVVSHYRNTLGYLHTNIL